MRTELRGGPKDGDTVDAPPMREARLVDFPDTGANGVHRYMVSEWHARQSISWTEEWQPVADGDEFWQVAKYIGYFPRGDNAGS